jgi:hypothetical protein
MPKRKSAASVKVLPAIVAIVRPVTTRLSRIEALLIEMRSALDLQIKHTTRLQTQVDTLGARRR